MIASNTRTDLSPSAVVFGGVVALVAFALIAAFGVGSSAKAKSNEIARQQILADHSALCQRFGLARTPSEQADCIGELDALKNRHEVIFVAQNESLL